MIRELLHKGLIAQAFAELRARGAAFPGEGYCDRIDALRTEFAYMSDFMMQGYRDDSRGQLFADLTQRLQAMDYDLTVRETLLSNPYVVSAVKALTARDSSDEALQEALRRPAGAEEHWRILSDTFVLLLTSGHWQDRQMESWRDYIASADTDMVDAATLTAAIMMSAICNFSSNKVRCLVDVYALSANEKVRQRAFAGALLAIEAAGADKRAETAVLLDSLLSTEEAQMALVEMQIQMTACAKAESDSTEINSKIMPDLLKNQQLRFTKDGIVEREEMDDSLDPDAEERRMEAMTEGVNRIIEMQKNGSDVFFGGFSKMKRFPFFYKLVNWFTPFYSGHPGLDGEIKSLSSRDFVGKVTERGPFCDSDKYSFIIAMAGVVGQLPENVRKMMEEGQVAPMGIRMDGEAEPTASLLRLHFLQDMYRFFRINPLGTMLRNPFDHAASYRLWTIAAGSVSDSVRRVISSYIQRDRRIEEGGEIYDAARQVMESYSDKEGLDYKSCRAELIMRGGKGSPREAMGLFAECLNMKPRDASLMRGMARACYAARSYDKAAFYFDALHTLFPKRISYTLNYIMSRVRHGEAENVVNDMYKLEYENPDNQAVRNMLGWVLLCAHREDKALTVYQRLLQSVEARGDFSVCLNALYAFMVNGRVQEGVDMMQQHRQTLDAEQQRHFPETLVEAMREDEDLLMAYGIGMAERSIVASQFVHE